MAVHDCPNCGTVARMTCEPPTDMMAFDCGICGSYRIAERVYFEGSDARRAIGANGHLLSAHIREQILRGVGCPQILPDDAIRIVDPRNRKSIIERLDCLLLSVLRMWETPLVQDGHEWITLDYARDYPLAWASGPGEFRRLLNVCKSSGTLLTAPESGHNVEGVALSAEGLRRVQELRRTTAEGNQCFVAMRFSDQMQEVYDEAIQPAIEAAGYKPYQVGRASHNNYITSEIIANIRRSSLMVADFSHNNPGVYYEAGFALGLDIPVIRTCRKDRLDKVHFDTKQVSHVLWQTSEDLRRNLEDHILATAPLRS
jgi:nucleoside 2-deoxyribosyltransferase